MFRGVPAAMTTILLVSTLTACHNNSESNPTPPPFTPSAAPTSPTASASEPTQAADEAIAAYRRYRQVIDAMTNSGGTDVKDIPAVATGVELKATQNQAATYRGRRIRTIGSTEVVWVKPAKVAPANGGGITAVAIQACYDTSRAKAVDATGKNVQVPGTPTRWLDDRDLRFVDGAWKVSNGRNRGAQC
jgi:hypothetical protein